MRVTFLTMKPSMEPCLNESGIYFNFLLTLGQVYRDGRQPFEKNLIAKRSLTMNS